MYYLRKITTKHHRHHIDQLMVNSKNRTEEVSALCENHLRRMSKHTSFAHANATQLQQSPAFQFTIIANATGVKFQPTCALSGQMRNAQTVFTQFAKKQKKKKQPQIYGNAHAHAQPHTLTHTDAHAHAYALYYVVQTDVTQNEYVFCSGKQFSDPTLEKYSESATPGYWKSMRL